MIKGPEAQISVSRSQPHADALINAGEKQRAIQQHLGTSRLTRRCGTPSWHRLRSNDGSGGITLAAGLRKPGRRLVPAEAALESSTLSDR
jgi:hypothetical protein